MSGRGVGVVGAILALGGVALAVALAIVPIHMNVLRPQPALTPGGEFNLTLAPTGQTTRVRTPVTCLPIQGYFLPSKEQDPACLPKDAGHIHIAFIGLAAFAIGAVLWQVSGVERSLLRAH